MNNGTNWELFNQDCITGLRERPDESVDLMVTSIPFADKYTYSNKLEDMGNCQDQDDEFWTHLWFLFGELMRVMKPGRLLLWHIQDLRSYKGQHGFQGLRDISGRLTAKLEEAGFWYQSKWMIRKDPPTQMRRTNAQHLLYCQLRRNSLFSFPALPDYMIAFRKPGEPETPVQLVTDQSATGKHGLVWGTNECPKCKGNLGEFGPEKFCPHCGYEFTPEEIAVPDGDSDGSVVTLDMWQSWAESFWNDAVWTDIRMTDVLPNEKEGQDEKHICPMQLTAINRVLFMYSNRGELVLDPFAGIGSVGYEALKMGRKFIGYELKEAYFRKAQYWLQAADADKNQMELFG